MITINGEIPIREFLLINASSVNDGMGNKYLYCSMYFLADSFKEGDLIAYDLERLPTDILKTEIERRNQLKLLG